MRFCAMCDTSAGSLEHWEMVTLWHLEGLFPCDYHYPDYEWITKSREWIDRMNQQTHQNIQFRMV
jgi:hypothetical protein